VPETIEQQALRDAVRGLLAGHRPGDDDGVRLWRRLTAEIGVAGLAIPERFGGSGAGPAEVHVVQEELGRVLADTPMLGSAVLATEVLLESGDEEACGRLLPGMAAGARIAALAWTTAAGRWDPDEVACRAARGRDGAWIVEGEPQYVLDGAAATELLVPAYVAGGIGLFEIQPGQPGVSITSAATMDRTRGLAIVRLTRAAARRIGGLAALTRARDRAAIALSAEQAGAAARALEVTVEYTKARVQFGRPIATFQALQHRMADLHVLVRSARSLSWAAAEAAQRNAPDIGLRAAAAKAYCSEALREVAAEMLQMHGAIAMTWEHEAHWYFKRAHSSALLLGSPASHVARVAAEVIDGVPS
jgi:alkylation response protein AidB-like acyl-CoA dehydrogenase